jgi:plastocyanin
VLRWPLPIAILALMAVPASAADESVRATPTSTFSPSEVTIDLGDKVTWGNDGGFHNVKFDDGSFEQPGAPDFNSWTVERTFDKPGHFRYYCEQHGGPDGSGMSGTVHVRDATGSVPETPPGLTVSTKAAQGLPRVLKRGVRARTQCENGCDAKFKLTIDARTAKRFGFPKRRTTIGTRSVSLDPAGAVDVDVKLTDRAKRKLGEAKRAFKVRLDVNATKDTPESARRTIEIKP